jgi:hypothetical protein
MRNDPMEWNNDYTESVAEFLESASAWIRAAEKPLAVQLRALAAGLDKSMREDGTVQSAAASQFAQTWARLAKRDPAGSGSGGDELGFLEPIPGLEAGLLHGAGCQCGSCGPDPLEL